MLKIEKTHVDGWEEANEAMVKNFPNYTVTRGGEVINRLGKTLKPSATRNGYLRVSLSNKKRKHKRLSIHRLVAEAFIPNPDNLPQVNHINRDRTDNRVENLEWCTALENLSHSNVIQRAAEANRRKVRCIDTGKVYNSIKEVCELFGTSHSNIVACCTGRRITCGGMKWAYL